MQRRDGKKIAMTGRTFGAIGHRRGFSKGQNLEYKVVCGGGGRGGGYIRGGGVVCRKSCGGSSGRSLEYWSGRGCVSMQLKSRK